MKVKDLLDVQEVLEKRKTPCDMHDDELKSQEILNDLAVIENRVTAIKHNFKK